MVSVRTKEPRIGLHHSESAAWDSGEQREWDERLMKSHCERDWESEWGKRKRGYCFAFACSARQSCHFEFHPFRWKPLCRPGLRRVSLLRSQQTHWHGTAAGHLRPGAYLHAHANTGLLLYAAMTQKFSDKRRGLSGFRVHMLRTEGIAGQERLWATDGGVTAQGCVSRGV